MTPSYYICFIAVCYCLWYQQSEFYNNTATTTAPAQQHRERAFAPTFVSRVVDGDTLVIPAPYLPYPLKAELLLRLYGIDAPETGWRADCKEEQQLANRATIFTRNCIMGHHTNCDDRCSSDYHVMLRKWDKYGGRVLGDIYFPGSDTLLSELLTNHSLAIPFSGRNPAHSWCGV